jgi:predicted phosphate transport protein (TIGR00153 family)
VGIKSIEDAEHGADRITHETVQLLHTTFVTPFDRDDIHRLISRMDDVLDLIQDTAESLVLYDIQKVTPEATQLAELLLRCAERVQSAVGLMASMADAPAILKICQEIDRLESDADKVMATAISGTVPQRKRRAPVDQAQGQSTNRSSPATDKCQDVAKRDRKASSSKTPDARRH